MCPPRVLHVSGVVCFRLPVGCDVCGVRQVPPQRGGGRDLLGADRPLGQPEQQEDPRAAYPPVSGRAHGTVTRTHEHAHTVRDTHTLEHAHTVR